MKTIKILSLILAIMVTISCSPMSWAEAMPTDPQDGKPPVGSKPSVASLSDQVLYQRAFEAVLWSMPMVQI